MAERMKSSDSIENDHLIAFRKPVTKGMSILGTSGLILGLGLTGSGSAIANGGGVVCTVGNTVVAVPRTVPTYLADNLRNINAQISSDPTAICLNGDFEVDETIFVAGQVNNFVGVGESSITMVGTQGILLYGNLFDDGFNRITIENLTISSDGESPAVVAYNISVKNSTFIGNQNGAVFGVDVEIEDSTFIGNSTDVWSFDQDGSTFPGWGGAVISYGALTVKHSTFIGNTAELGGAIASLDLFNGSVNITNSTFVDNTADGVGSEGGAISAISGEILFSTFVNNEASAPVADADVPGNAIYKSGSETLRLGANIFAGSSPFPQLGIGAPIEASRFTDLGGNVFSTSIDTEDDIDILSGTVFGATLASLFGTNTPVVSTHQPNTSGTQTIGLIETSPARNVVPVGEPFASVLVDQRGVPRTGEVADAGAFEGFVVPPTNPPTSPTLAKTGSDAPWWLTVSSVALMALGGTLSALSARRHRRSI